MQIKKKEAESPVLILVAKKKYICNYKEKLTNQQQST